MGVADDNCECSCPDCGSNRRIEKWIGYKDVDRELITVCKDCGRMLDEKREIDEDE